MKLRVLTTLRLRKANKPGVKEVECQLFGAHSRTTVEMSPCDACDVSRTRRSMLVGDNGGGWFGVVDERKEKVEMSENEIEREGDLLG